jgi:hypothetical protein
MCSVLQLLVTANLVPSSSILITLMIEAIRSSKNLVLTKVTPSNFAEGGILHLSEVFDSNVIYAVICPKLLRAPLRSADDTSHHWP